MPPKNNHERRRSRSKSNNKSGNISSSTSTPTMTKNEDSTFEEAIKGMDSMVRKELIRKVGKDLWKKLSWKQRHQFAFPTERIIIKKPSTMITTKKNKKEIIDQKKINQKKYMNVAAVDADADDSVVVVDVKTTSLISDPAKDIKIVAKKSALMSTTPATNTSAHTYSAAASTANATDAIDTVSSKSNPSLTTTTTTLEAAKARSEAKRAEADLGSTLATAHQFESIIEIEKKLKKKYKKLSVLYVNETWLVREERKKKKIF